MSEAHAMIADRQPGLSLEGCWTGEGICKAYPLVSLRTSKDSQCQLIRTSHGRINQIEGFWDLVDSLCDRSIIELASAGTLNNVRTGGRGTGA
jgi:hypothetical protein